MKFSKSDIALYQAQQEMKKQPKTESLGEKLINLYVKIILFYWLFSIIGWIFGAGKNK
jgi:hypothetical protein